MSGKAESFSYFLVGIRNLHSYLAASRPRLISFFVLNLVLIAIQLSMPIVAGRVVNALTSGQELLDVWGYLVVALLLMLSTLSLSSWLQFESWCQNSAYSQALIMAMYKKLLSADTNDSKNSKQSDLQVRFSSDVGVLAHLWPTGCVIAARQVLTILVAAAVLLHISWQLALSIGIFLPLAVSIFRHFSKKLSFLAQSARAGIASTNGILLESLAAHGLAVASGTEAYHLDRLRNSLKLTQGKIQKTQVYSTKMGVSLGLLPIAITGMIWLVGGFQVQQAILTTGDLAAFALVLSVLYSPINGLFTASSAIVFEAAALRRIIEILNLPKLRSSRISSVYKKNFDIPPSIALQRLCFNREGRELFREFSLNIPAASIASIKGENGVGKTTLLSLIFGVYPAQANKVFFNEKPLSEYDIAHTLSISYLPQDVMLFSDSVRNNIILGRNIPDHAIWRLACNLQLESFFECWSGQLDAQIEEGGRNLSGGERQRIGLMRALIGEPAILLMDEPEQNLDQQSVVGLLKYLEQIKGKITCVLVTHSNSFDNIVDYCFDLSISEVRR
jgi:ABC-type multidrug transport system fused ATPase/permease subunit